MRALTLALLGSLAVAAEAEAEPWPDLGRPPAGPAARAEGANDAALIVAIEDYAYVPDVPGARRNAADWRTWLRSRGVRQVKVLADVEALHGFDAQGRPAGILSAVEQTAAKVRPGGTFWFVFIGHGAPNGDPTQPDGLLLAHGVQQSPDGLRLQGIPVNAQLLPRLTPRAQGARSIAILDACFSGKDTQGRAVVPGLQPVFVTSAARVPPGVTLLSAAKGDQFAGPLPGQARPAFSYLALGALRGWADADGDRKITPREVQAYVEDTLFRLVTGRTQTPEARGAVDDPVAAAREAGPNLEGLAGSLAGRARTPSPVDDFERRLAAAEAQAAGPAPAGDLSPLEAEMARLAATRAARERLEQEEAERRARALRLHAKDVDARWAKVLRLAEQPRKGVPVVDAFLALYAEHPLGNPRLADATALKSKLEAALDARADADHRAEVDRAWAMTKKVADGGGPEGQQAVELFLKRYADHPRGNHRAAEARQVLRGRGNSGDEVDALLGALDGGSTAPHRPRPAPRPTDPRLPESLSRQQILRVVKSNARDVAACRDHGALTGTLMMAMVIEPDGRVSTATVTTAKFKGTPIAHCVEQRVRAFRFPPFRGDEMRLNMPFAL